MQCQQHVHIIWNEWLFAKCMIAFDGDQLGGNHFMFEVLSFFKNGFKYLESPSKQGWFLALLNLWFNLYLEMRI